jgi:glycosyltransferase involved in cell wall biosynthesis
MPPSTPTVSVVIPCFNEVGTLRELTARVLAEFDALNVPVELIYIDDGSTDGSRDLLRQLAAAEHRVRLILFRRNCGKSAALDAGFRAVRGQLVLMLDADLQDDPKEIPRFLEALQRVDMVVGWKEKRLDPISKTLPSKLFNGTVRKLTGVKLHDMNCGFKGFRRAVVDELNVYGELHRYLPVLANARGFTIEELAVTHHPRRSGVSKYGWERYLRGLFDLVTVLYITRYRFRPLHLFGGWGISCLLGGAVLGAVLNVPMLLLPQVPRGHFLLWLLAVALFIIGPLLIGIGLIAEGQLATDFRQIPPAPIAEVIEPAEATEVEHV